MSYRERQGYTKSKVDAKAKSTTHSTNENWLRGLEGEVSYLFIDEATPVKNKDTASHTVCHKYVRAEFNVLATGTPDVNCITDLNSLLEFLTAKDTSPAVAEDEASTLDPENFNNYNPYNAVDGDKIPWKACLRTWQNFWSSGV